MTAAVNRVDASLPSGVDGRLLLIIGGLAALSLAVNFVTGGEILAVLGVLIGLGVLGVMWFIPLRWSVSVLLFLCFTLEAPYEAFGLYIFRTPWSIVGTIMLGNLNIVTHVPALLFTGFDVTVAYLFIINWYRRSHGVTMDSAGNTPVARPLLTGISISLSTMAVMVAVGLGTGATVIGALLQIQKLVLSVVFFGILHAAYRGRRDLPTLARILIFAALYRAVMAIYIHRTMRMEDGSPFPCATTHADSSLFAAAVVLLLILRNEEVKGSSHWSRLLAALVILYGIVCNGRRLAWVQIAGSLIIVALMSPWTPLKRRIARVVIVSLPLIGLYIGAGWNNTGSSMFKPVKTVRSILDSKSDGSTEWRDLENMNLVKNISDHPFFGTGYGHEYIEYIILPSVADAYPRFKLAPHNSLIAFVVFAGPGGWAGTFAMVVATVFLAARTYRRSRDPDVRAACMICVVLVFLFLQMTYGDIGVTLWMTTITLGPAMMLAGKLAISSGAYPYKPKARATSLPAGVGAA